MQVKQAQEIEIFLKVINWGKRAVSDIAEVPEVAKSQS